jgi:threonine dehydrogenase-like Zn-dependent dehydrogenase
VVLRITTSAVCGSDLHQYHGRVAGLDLGVVMGDEFMGVVEEAGPAVRQFRKGDRVIAPFSISCGFCEWCRMRLPTRCVTTGRAVFGGRFGKQYPGGQAEAIRVPFADHMCERVPAGLADEDVFFLGDILSTGYVCAENAAIRPGDTVAVFGAGPVGLLALQSAHLFGPSRVFVAADPGGTARADADHHPHHAPRRRPPRLRDLRPQGGGGDQGDAEALIWPEPAHERRVISALVSADRETLGQ